MRVIPTTRPPLFPTLRALYVKYLIANAEEDAKHAEAQAYLYRKEAERLRVELSLLQSV